MSATGKKLRTLGGVLLGVMLSGCISFSGHFGTKIRVEHIPKIEDGVTTREEIMSWFGPPSAFFNPSFLDVILGDEDEMMDTGTALLNDVYRRDLARGPGRKTEACPDSPCCSWRRSRSDAPRRSSSSTPSAPTRPTPRLPWERSLRSRPRDRSPRPTCWRRWARPST